MNLADYATSKGLTQVGVRPKFGEYLKQVWQRRDFALVMSIYASESANARSRLGGWWLVLVPSLQAFTYGLIFGFILGSLRPANFIPFERERERERERNRERDRETEKERERERFFQCCVICMYVCTYV